MRLDSVAPDRRQKFLERFCSAGKFPIGVVEIPQSDTPEWCKSLGMIIKVTNILERRFQVAVKTCCRSFD
jgi:hypothetical protein